MHFIFQNRRMHHHDTTFGTYEFDVVGSDENKAKSQKKTNTKKSALEPLAPPSAPELAAPDAVKGKKEKQI